MAAAIKLMSVGVMALSFLFGFIFFFLTNGQSKEQRKLYMEEIFSQLINLIIFIWISKIILSFPLFMNDPISVLAYPSGANSFYLALFFSAAVFHYKSRKWQLDSLLFLESAMLVFLAASFAYEFIQYIYHNNQFAFGYLVLLTVMLLVFLFIQKRVTAAILLIIIIICWSMGVLLLYFLQPFVTVFGYIVSPWFLGLFILFSLLYIFFLKRKRRL
ncbi:hypothetical protein [Virgibacillus ihumii]|uniref:hypothetical protein n=1 Tax=Virgibacillus ihumii TaxID=2686091 RepID=UPI00157C5CB2|nr:hypothetical protein [Virgibacillus ihumii]